MSAPELNNFYTTKAGIVIPTITGTVSALSSLAIICFILSTRNNTIYHRIMFFMSLSDIMASVAIALTTLPMPKDVIYPYAGLSYGTVKTCEAQGFLYLTGSSLVICMNAGLCVYYLCILVLNMREIVFRKCIEPLLYIFSFTGCIVLAAHLLLKEDFLNPTISDPFCGPSAYPEGCNKQDTPHCRGGDNSSVGKDFYILFMTVCSTGFVILVITMGSIFYTFAKRERTKRVSFLRSEGVAREDRHRIEREWESAQRNRRIISVQILMYIAAFVITWIMAVVTLLSEKTRIQQWAQILRMIFQPLQGFFNMFIFFYHKVHVICRNAKKRKFCETIRVLCCQQSPEFVVISNIDSISRVSKEDGSLSMFRGTSHYYVKSKSLSLCLTKCMTSFL